MTAALAQGRPERPSPSRAIILADAVTMLSESERRASAMRPYVAFAAVWSSLLIKARSKIKSFWTATAPGSIVPSLRVVDGLAWGVADFAPALAHFEPPATIRIDGTFARDARDSDLHHVIAHELAHALSATTNGWEPDSAATEDEYPLRRLITCGICGSRLTASTSRSHTGAKHRYYHCPSKTKTRSCKSVRPEVLESAFEAALSQLKPGPAAVRAVVASVEAAIRDSNKQRETERRALLKRQADLKRRQLALAEDRIARVIEAEIYRELDDRFAIDLADIDRSLSLLDRDDVDAADVLRFAAELLANLDPVLRALKPDSRQELTSALFRQRVVREERFKPVREAVFSSS